MKMSYNIYILNKYELYTIHILTEIYFQKNSNICLQIRLDSISGFCDIYRKLGQQFHGFKKIQSFKYMAV